MDAQYNAHFEENLNAWVMGKISASERRVLMTKWIGSAWSIFCTEYQEAIKASFIKCGIVVPIDGSMDSELIKIRGLDHYSVPPWQSNTALHECESSQDPNLSLSHTALPEDLLQEPELSDSDCYTEGTFSGNESESDSDGYSQCSAIEREEVKSVGTLKEPEVQRDVQPGVVLEVVERQPEVVLEVPEVPEVPEVQLEMAVHPQVSSLRQLRSSIKLGEQIM